MQSMALCVFKSYKYQLIMALSWWLDSVFNDNWAIFSNSDVKVELHTFNIGEFLEGHTPHCRWVQVCCRSVHLACIPARQCIWWKVSSGYRLIIMSCAEVALTTAFWVLFMNEQIWQALIFAWSCVGAFLTWEHDWPRRDINLYGGEEGRNPSSQGGLEGTVAPHISKI